MRKPYPNTTDRHVGSRVRMRRLMMKMSQTRVADALGVTFQQVQKYEKGTNRISASRLQQMAGIFSVPVSYFFEGVPETTGGQNAGKETPDYIGRFIATREGIALAEAFSRIPDAGKRRLIVRLAEVLAEAGS